MPLQRRPRLDSSLALALQGYAWLPNERRRLGSDTIRTRLAGRPVLGLCGPDGARFFYDRTNVQRAGALPEPVLSTLFGHGAVHTLDGEEHRVRKAMFLSVAKPADTVEALADRVGAAWDAAVGSWTGSVVLLDEASRVITRGACEWAGIPVDERDVPDVAADLVAMIDGFATPGPRHWRARQARKRCEESLGRLVQEVRRGANGGPTGTVVDAVARHRDADGTPLDPRTAAVEILNVVRPTVAVAWFVAYVGHALHRWPEHRERLRTGEREFAESFAQEVRRFYPFAPFIGGRALRPLSWQGLHVPAGSTVLLDLYGHNHHPDVFPEPYRFDPVRFLGRAIGEWDLVPQGAGDPRTGHRCPGEDVTVAVLRTLAGRLAALDYRVPEQDLTIPLNRIPTRPRSGFVLERA
jgi:fatty-acid peroxygenase